MKYTWSMAPVRPNAAASLMHDLGISSLLAQCLVNRGLMDADSAQRFLEPRLKCLADPFLLPNMEAAVDRLMKAREAREPVVIFGDYDVDGVTATALLTEVFSAFGWTVYPYLPHRIDEGYGLTQTGVENCLRQHPTNLVLAVDCGSTAGQVITELRQRGVDVVVLDHHQVAVPPPPASALVNPQLSSPGQPGFREMCSAGLAFKLAHAILKRAREMEIPGAHDYDLRACLDLVALGTIADLVPLTGENRILLSSGVARLNQTGRPGLVALREVARIAGNIGAYEVGFQLAPRLNAAGRLENAQDALQLLLTRDIAEARSLAARLDARNRERQEIERQMAARAIEAVRARFDPARDYVIVEGQADWHIGVVGIVASRVLQEFYRPTIILGGDGVAWRGSGRSIQGFNLADALGECSPLLVRHGGHAMAAGVTMLPANLESFRAHLNEVARRTLKPEQLQPVLRLDAEAELHDLTLERIRELAKLQHTGMGNPPVQVVLRNLGHQRPPQHIGADKRHVKLWVSNGQAAHVALWWGAGDSALPRDRFDLAVTPQINSYQGHSSVQLKVLDWRPSAGPGF